MKNYAVALAILGDKMIRGETAIIIGIRTPEANAQHPNVVSVPTERIPKVLFDDIAARASLVSPYSAEDARPGSDSVTYAVKSVLSHKLGLGDMLEIGALTFSAAPRSVLRGISPILEDGDAGEEWSMVQIAVSLSEWFIPERTASYTDIGPILVADFIAKAHGKSMVFTDRRSHRVGGLCVKNTAQWLSEAIFH